MPIEYCEAAAGGTCSDLKAIYSGQDGVPLTISCFFIPGSGWMVSVCPRKVFAKRQLCHHENAREVSPYLARPIEFQRGTASKSARDGGNLISDIGIFHFISLQWR